MVLKAAILFVVVGALAACSKNDEEEYKIPGSANYDFVTVEKSDAKGTVFEFQRVDDSPVVSYTSSYSFTQNERINAGDRLIICYTMVDGDYYVSGPINLYGYITPANTEKGVVQGTPAQYDSWKSQSGKLTSIWRSGNYLNIQNDIYVKRIGRPEKYILVVDKSTIESDYPELHVICDVPADNIGQNLGTIYASFDISSLWSLSTCKGLRIYFPTTDGDVLTTFHKAPDL